MPLVSQALSTRPATQETLVDTLNREVVPVLRAIREVVNARLIRATETVGDGVATVYTMQHDLGTEDVLVAAYSVSTGADLAFTVTGRGENSVTVTFAVAPGVGDARLLVRL